MIADQQIGRSFMGAFDYSIKKLNHIDPTKRAEILDTNFSSLEKKLLAFEVDLVKQLRPSLNKYVYHTSLNFHNDDKLDNDTLIKIAHQYLTAMGYTNNQYIIFRHHDADHPHLHLLVNRITFDGDVVSDSNNFKRSEKVLRNIERQYSLVQVNPEQNSRLRPVTKNEIEKIKRTGKPSDKMVLQEIMKTLIAKSNTVTDMIRYGEQAGVHFLFNQQSTGRISGVTYFFKDYKITGQKLGNLFKWGELIKAVSYEPNRDSKAISEANERTKLLYGDFTSPQISAQANKRTDPESTTDESFEDNANPNRERAIVIEDRDILYRDNTDTLYPDTFNINISIADDVDDEAVYGKNRNRKGRGYSR